MAAPTRYHATTASPHWIPMHSAVCPDCGRHRPWSKRADATKSLGDTGIAIAVEECDCGAEEVCGCGNEVSR